MVSPRENIAPCDPIWSQLREQAQTITLREPAMAGFVYDTILQHERLEQALSYHLSRKLGAEDLGQLAVRVIIDEAMAADPQIGAAVRADLSAVFERDPACHSHADAFLFFKGFLALQCHRIAHWLWQHDRRTTALFLQSRVSERFAVDIHPAARMGRGIMIDHATGVVIGETAVVEDDVSIMQGVTLGGTGKEEGDRHPKIRRGSLISLGAKILGNIEIGEYSRVGAGSVVLKSVPAHCTAVGVPAKLVNCDCGERPSQQMNHIIEEPGNTG
ncbi:MAG: serine O-acetyltransferase [Alphaproteobacteria bacterium]|nr:serine O-acetyltransferase [Alphaproteobacteria bacterium]